MQITRSVLTDLGVSAANASKYLIPLSDAMGQYGIDTLLRIAHFLAQVVHESACMTAVCENLNYSAEGLLKVFPTHFKGSADAQSYAHQPEKIANRVYAGRMGNGTEASGDGYRYRGRGLLQLTGKTNYRDFSRWSGTDCVADPDQLLGPCCAQSAVFFWDSHRLNGLADADDLAGITRKINGGLNGLAARRALLEKAKEALRGLPLDPDPAARVVQARVASAPPGPAAPGPAQAVSPAVSLAMSPPAVSQSSFAPTYRVMSTGLHFRSTPKADQSNQIATLCRGTAVETLGEADSAGWVRVRVPVNGKLREGFVAARYLAPLPQGVRTTTQE